MSDYFFVEDRSGNGHEPNAVRRVFLLLSTLLFKNNKLAENIIQDHHDNIRDDLHDEVVYMELVHKDPQEDRLDH